MGNIFSLPQIQIDNSMTDSLEEEKKSMERYLKEQKIKSYQQMGIPRKYYDYTFSNIDYSNESFKSKVEKICKWKNDENRKSLCFTGTYGTGKTLLATLLCKELNGKYIRASYLINDINECKNFKSEKTVNEKIAEYGAIPFLVIDEIGRGNNDTDLLFQVINESLENGNTVLLVSNLSINDIGKFMGGAMADRLKTFNIVSFTEESFRK